MGLTIWHRIKSIIRYSPLSTKNSTSVQENKIEWNSGIKTTFGKEKNNVKDVKCFSVTRDFCLAYNTLHSQQVHSVLATDTANSPKLNTVIF